MSEVENQIKETPETDKEKLEFALNTVNQQWANLYNIYGGKGNAYKEVLQNFYTSNPYVQNMRIKALKSSPSFPDRTNLEGYLSAPQLHEKELREMSWSLSANNFTYYKILTLYSNILTYKNYVYPKYVNKKDTNSPKFKSEHEFVTRIIDKIKPEYTFRRITLECFIEGKRAYIPRVMYRTVNGKKVVDYFFLQELPSDWWKPVAISTKSHYVASFNFAYFWTAGTSINQFPDEFKNYYGELNYSIGYDDHGNLVVDLVRVPDHFDCEYINGKWYIWHEINEAFVFSADESNAWHVPPFLGLFLSGQDLQSYYTLQTQLASIPLYGILTGEIPFAEKAASGTYINDFRITPDILISFTSQANQVLPAGVSAFFSPFENIKFSQFEEQVNSSKVYSDALQQFLGTSGTSGLLTTSAKPSVAQVKASEKIEGRFGDFLYSQFERFMDFVLANNFGLNFDWKFKIFGTIFNDKDKKAELKDAIVLGNTSFMLEYLAVHDMDIFSALSISDLVDSSKLYDKMKQLTTAYSSPSTNNPTGISDGKRGRKALDPDEVENDATAASQDSGMNTADMRSYSLDSDEFSEAVESIVEDMLE